MNLVIPWMFAYDRLKYPPVYYYQMKNVPHPEVYEHLKNGGMSVQLGMTNIFGCILVDQAIEEIANKDTLDSKGHERIQFKPWSSRQMLPNDRV